MTAEVSASAVGVYARVPSEWADALDRKAERQFTSRASQVKRAIALYLNLTPIEADRQNQEADRG